MRACGRGVLMASTRRLPSFTISPSTSSRSNCEPSVGKPAPRLKTGAKTDWTAWIAAPMATGAARASLTSWLPLRWSAWAWVSSCRCTFRPIHLTKSMTWSALSDQVRPLAGSKSCTGSMMSASFVVGS